MKYFSTIDPKLILLNASRIIKLTIILILSFALNASANGFGRHKLSPVSEEKTGKNNYFAIITGTVTGEGGVPLAGVSVSVKGTSRGTTTDAKGNFSIDAAPNTTLVFSYVGFKTQEVRVSGQGAINVSLQTASQSMNEVVVIGYG